MTALAVAPSLFDQLCGGPTLDDLIVGAWEGLTAQRVVACPVCDGELAPASAFAGGGSEVGAGAGGGRCLDCGTVLT